MRGGPRRAGPGQRGGPSPSLPAWPRLPPIRRPGWRWTHPPGTRRPSVRDLPARVSSGAVLRRRPWFSGRGTWLVEMDWFEGSLQRNPRKWKPRRCICEASLPGSNGRIKAGEKKLHSSAEMRRKGTGAGPGEPLLVHFPFGSVTSPDWKRRSPRQRGRV